MVLTIGIAVVFTAGLFAAPSSQPATTGGPATVLWAGSGGEIETYTWFKQMLSDLNIKVQWTGDLNLALAMTAPETLPDMLWVGPDIWESIVKSELALDLTPYIAAGRELESLALPQYSAMTQLLRELAGGASKNLYFLSPMVGMGSPGGSIQDSRGYLVRWDYYKEIGCPPITNDADFLNVLRQMQARHPTTKTGKPTYAIGVEPGLGDLGGYRAAFTAAKVDPWSRKGAFATSLKDGHLINGYSNVSESQYWLDMKFYNSVYRAGLFDPDTFTMPYDQYNAKVADGVYMGLYFRSTALIETERDIDPNTLADYFSVPSVGAVVNADTVQPLGVFPATGVWVPKTSKNKEAVLRMLNWLYTPKNMRLIYSGVQGTHWDYDASGKPYITALGLQMRQTPALWAAEGWDKDMLMLGLTNATTYTADGYPFDLALAQEYRVTVLSPVQADMARYYNVSYPMQAAYNLSVAGQTLNFSNGYGRSVGGLVSLSTDQNRVITELNDILTRAMPNLIQARDDAAFAQIQRQVLADLTASGEAALWNWYSAEYSRIEAIVKPLYNQVKASLQGQK
jgi:multiple sugar transport system substrate-binding protein